MIDEETVLRQEIKRLYFNLILTGPKAGKLLLSVYEKQEQPPFYIIRLAGPLTNNKAIIRFDRKSATEIHCSIKMLNNHNFNLVVVDKLINNNPSTIEFP